MNASPWGIRAIGACAAEVAGGLRSGTSTALAGSTGVRPPGGPGAGVVTPDQQTIPARTPGEEGGAEALRADDGAARPSQHADRIQPVIFGGEDVLHGSQVAVQQHPVEGRRLRVEVPQIRVPLKQLFQRHRFHRLLLFH
jgi:hypothetical protein